MLNHLFTMNYWVAALLSFIPFLINVSLLLFTFFKLKKTQLNILFVFFLIPLALWQLSDTLIRFSATSALAINFFHMIFPLTCMLVPTGLHFTLLFTKQWKYIQKSVVLFMIYFPALVFCILSIGRVVDYHVAAHPFFGWVLVPEGGWVTFLYALWMSFSMFVVFALLFRHMARNLKSKTNLKYQSLLVCVGFGIPIIQGVITEFAFPYLFGLRPFSITSSSMSVFSICVVIGLVKYQLLDFSPLHVWSQIVRNMGQGLVITDSKGKIQYANRKFRSMTGYDILELTGLNSEQLLGKKLDFKTMKKNSDMPDEPFTGISEVYETQIRKRNEDNISINATLSPYYNKHQQLVGTIALVTDITKRKQLEASLNQKIRDLNMFIYRASHDLKAPLASIMGIYNLGVNEVKDPEIKKYFDLIYQSTQRLDMTLKELADLANITQGKINYEEISMENLIMQILSSLDQQPNFNLVRYDIDVDAEVSLVTDKRLLKAILQNLIANAINYADTSKPDPYLEIRVSGRNGHTMLSFKDNGCGIPEADREKVFDMFYRAHKNSKGTGLGLFITRSAAEKINANISFSSEVREGTTFRVLIPNHPQKEMLKETA